jgi:hypothetical protein
MDENFSILIVLKWMLNCSDGIHTIVVRIMQMFILVVLLASSGAVPLDAFPCLSTNVLRILSTLEPSLLK